MWMKHNVNIVLKNCNVFRYFDLNFLIIRGRLTMRRNVSVEIAASELYVTPN